MNKRKYPVFALGILRKCTIFNDLRHIIKPYHVNLMYADKISLFRGKKSVNVGDYLSKVVFDYLLQYKGISSYKRKHTVRISFIGSVIQFLGAKTIVYGSGFLREDVVRQFAEKKVELDIRAVRGPLTKKSLEEIGYKVPNIFGDPAILLPLFYVPVDQIIINQYIVIPHWTKIKYYQNYPCLSTLTNDWKFFIDTIVSSKLVISASLHGLILAEVYGVPAIFLNDTENDDIYKYKDYYYSTGRLDFRIANNIEEALQMEYSEIPSFDKMRQNFLKAFPIDKIN